jgi:hypothetical protein
MKNLSLVEKISSANRVFARCAAYSLLLLCGSNLSHAQVVSGVPVVGLPVPVATGITSASAAFGNIALTSPTPVYVRYSVAGADTPLTGQFCAALNPALAVPATGVATFNPCAAGSLLGLTQAAMGFGAGAQTGESLIVSETIARQAAQRALANGNGNFYFVRQFASGKFAVVLLRLTGDTANQPIAFTHIRLGFQDGNGVQNVGFFKREQTLPKVNALLRYQGAGMLRARWEVVQPGDIAPNAQDLTSEAMLTPLQRAQQHRYRVLDTVSQYLPATGQIILNGPDASTLPNTQNGEYLLLLRIEAGDSLTGAPSGIAPFVLPVLRYYIGDTNGPNFQAQTGAPTAINLIAPAAGATVDNKIPLSFQWEEVKNTTLYRLEIETNGKPFYTARVRAKSGINSYTAPPFITMGVVNKPSRWRVVTLNSDGQFLGISEWREISTPATAEH